MLLSLEKRLTEQLNKRVLNGNLRVLNTTGAKVDFFSNDYLGLSSNQALEEIVKNKYENKSIPYSGATGSRLLSGNNKYYLELEKKLALLFKGESSLIFNSGYTANLAIFSTLPQKGDTIIYDELIHACIKEGSRLSFADRFSFRHNDLKDLERKLKKGKGEKFVAIESVYSMDGDLAPIADIIEVCKRYSAILIVDEAHSTGVFGNNGNGLVNEIQMEEYVPIRTFTFGKAIGSHGACVVSGKIITDYLINFARSFIFTTALPVHNLMSIESAFDFIKDNPTIQTNLRKKISFFKELLQEANFINKGIKYIESTSAIQAIIIPGNSKAKSLSDRLIKNSFDVRPILSPTVKEGEERVRICIHSFNTENEIEGLISIIKNFEF